jgi:glycosyltransferase involved in cell wall biosynthesis
MIRRHRPQAIWSTFPIATAHRIGMTLSRLSGLPWVADFRDSMTEDNYPRDRTERLACRRVERLTVERSRRVVFTTESTRRMYAERYPGVPPGQLLVIPNGYDEEDFSIIEADDRPTRTEGRPLRFIHAGLLYPDDRDPRPFFQTVARLKVEGALTQADVAIDLRASGNESYYEALIRELGIGSLVRLLPPLPHREALRDAARSDALLLFQAASCNHQIPAKVYEYLRLRRPILALTSHDGDTAAVLRGTGGATIVDIADTGAIHRVLPEFIQGVRAGTHPLAPVEAVERYSGRRQVGDLARCLDAAILHDDSPQSVAGRW